MIILLYILIALVPGLFWVWFYRRKDRANPEPRKLIFKVFFWGMLVTIPAIGLELAIDYFFDYSRSTDYIIIVISSLLIVAPIEELLKYFVVREKIYENKEFDEPIDGIIYAIVAALGFASLENLLVIFSEGTNAIILRFATATLMHALTTSIVGYYLSILKFSPKHQVFSDRKKRWFVAQGLLIAIILHALYNIIASARTSYALVFIAAIMIVMFVMVARNIKELKSMKSQVATK